MKGNHRQMCDHFVNYVYSTFCIAVQHTYVSQENRTHLLRLIITHLKQTSRLSCRRSSLFQTLNEVIQRAFLPSFVNSIRYLTCQQYSPVTSTRYLIVISPVNSTRYLSTVILTCQQYSFLTCQQYSFLTCQQ